jgi:hypothetical protein
MSFSGDASEEEIEFLRMLSSREGGLLQSIITGAKKPEGRFSFPDCSATQRIRLIEEVRDPLGSKGIPHERSF